MSQTVKLACQNIVTDLPVQAHPGALDWAAGKVLSEVVRKAEKEAPGCTINELHVTREPVVWDPYRHEWMPWHQPTMEETIRGRMPARPEQWFVRASCRVTMTDEQAAALQEATSGSQP